MCLFSKGEKEGVECDGGSGEDLGKDTIRMYEKNLFSLEWTKAKGLMYFFILSPVTDLNELFLSLSSYNITVFMPQNREGQTGVYC